MELTNEQYAARKAIFDWYREGGDEPFFLAGYAGTGKTTLIKHLIGEAKGNIAVVAPTNKAARVLREKGVTQAETVHRFLYGAPVEGRCECGTTTRNHDKKCPALKLSFLPKGMTIDGVFVEDLPPSMVIVDEASMVNERMAADLIAKGVPILAVGDPFQLPPVEGQPGFKMPSFEMTHIQRQAADNPIIRLAHDVRNGGRLKPGDYGAVRIVSNSLNAEGFDTDDWDQILTWRHTSRCMYNAQYRAILGRTSPLPEPGENVMFKSTHKELGIANGDVYPIEGLTDREDRPAVDLKMVMDDDGHTASISTWKLGFGSAQDWKELDTMDFRHKRIHARATFDYAITVHSAQGSEWPRVIVAKDGNTDRQWMYTALTRAREKALVCLGRDD